MTPRSSSSKPAWVQLYEARRVEVEVESRPPGRPPSLIPRRKIGLTLSQGEIQEIEVWQERLLEAVGTASSRQVKRWASSLVSARLAIRSWKVKGVDPETLLEMVEKMVG
jgi:hypothetical protein